MTQDPRADLDHVLWLGGSTCAGKTSVAERLAATHGLRVYHCDDAFEDHRRRADPDRHPGFCRIMDLTGPELWRRSVEDQIADLLAFYADEHEMILDDLRTLPADGPLLVEGTGLFPDRLAALGAGPCRSLFLISSGAFRRRIYPQRGAWVREMLNEAGGGVTAEDPAETFARWMARDDALARLRAERAAALGLPVVQVDGSRTIEETAALIGRHFGLKPLGLEP